ALKETREASLVMPRIETCLRLRALSMEMLDVGEAVRLERGHQPRNTVRLSELALQESRADDAFTAEQSKLALLGPSELGLEATKLRLAVLRAMSRDVANGQQGPLVDAAIREVVELDAVCREAVGSSD